MGCLMEFDEIYIPMKQWEFLDIYGTWMAGLTGQTMINHWLLGYPIFRQSCVLVDDW